MRGAVRRSPQIAAVLVGLLLAAGCAATHAVRPLGRGHAALTASLGGPLVTVGSATIPTPILSLGGAYGVRDDAEVAFHADATAALFGVLHVDPGVAYHPLVRDSGLVPTLTVAAAVHLLTNFSDTRVAPQVTLAGAWRGGGRPLGYLGGRNAGDHGAAAAPGPGPPLWGVGR